MEINYEDFRKVEIRVGTILTIRKNKKARQPALVLELDFGIEIGTSFGHLAGKIWRIGTMGYVCRKSNILRCLNSLEAVLRRNGYNVPANASLDAAYMIYDE